LADQQVAESGSWPARATDGVEQQVAREEATALARNIVAAEARLKQNKAQLADLNEQLAPGLQAQPGLGPVTTGTILTAYSHHGRIRNEAAFAGPLVRSPRQANRLLNLYRMVRSTRDLSPAAAFLGSESMPGQFEAVGFLLGLLTTRPRLLGQLITAVRVITPRQRLRMCNAPPATISQRVRPCRDCKKNGGNGVA
jgi:hypothetical protein